MPSTKRHKIQFPRNSQDLDQDEAHFDVFQNGTSRTIRFHDYDEIYKVPGLYEQLFYDRLKCCSHKKVCEILRTTVEQSHFNLTGLRVLDLGAGNGMVGEILKGIGISRIIGADIIPEAKDATERDRPGVYDEYYVTDFTALPQEEKEDLKSWSLDCLTCVAALGFGDIPKDAFIQAFNLLGAEGWVAFNIKETFLDNSDTSGFSKAIRELIFSEYLDLYHLERYRHRLSIEGEPLYYFAVAGRKNADIPPGIIGTE
ncbi:class I SAM-dependent DNA methyltransferase [Kiritimatiella glycovorans]|uniref:Putative methyltransferase (Contains TPR repeat) n=1 Tax=Kiritimatiella glycovorans TaxID=1307763 RepID=A0A0G3EIJ2_9BACT|nr:methyltransferase domain-containing protein [Kiritimatiella glycovorans]AKJ63959.1 putative methyltransferase (contains TPR repeat) [Kiritimatiella glycovorans]